tara:strand:- start:152 stop:1612 length:1461 start_codon:yes stop_codon:yes gene_type:complete
MNKSLQQLITLYEENNDNKEVQEKITSFICNRLPIEVVCWKKNLNKDKIKIEEKTFISDFLNDETKQFYYIEDSDMYIKYNNLNYVIINEDEILYLILSEISKNKLLLSQKQKIKNIIINEIKSNYFGIGIPESNTIQNIINYLYPVLFNTKSEAKYFLCIIGDNILKKQTNINFIVRNTYKIFVDHINNCFKDYYKYSIHDNFLYTPEKLESWENTRVLNFKSSIENKRFWQHFLDQNVLNLISVAMHYSQRYDNSEEYLCNKIEHKEKILYLKHNSKKDIIEKFKTSYTLKKENEKISKNELYYLWQLFLIDENIPYLFNKQETLIKFFDELNERKSNMYMNIYSEKLFVSRKFNTFWKSYIKEDSNEMIELSEIFYFFKQKTNIKTSSEREIVNMIQYFYPYIKILNNKYINNISCILWNKKATIQSVIKNISSQIDISNLTNIKLYKKYCVYLKKNKNELVVNKTYFMDVIKEIKEKLNISL